MKKEELSWDIEAAIYQVVEKAAFVSGVQDYLYSNLELIDLPKKLRGLKKERMEEGRRLLQDIYYALQELEEIIKSE